MGEQILTPPPPRLAPGVLMTRKDMREVAWSVVLLRLISINHSATILFRFPERFCLEFFNPYQRIWVELKYVNQDEFMSH